MVDLQYYVIIIFYFFLVTEKNLLIYFIFKKVSCWGSICLLLKSGSD